MDTIAVSELRANLMKILKKIELGSSIYITSRGKIVAKLVPPEKNREKVKNILEEISKTAIIKDVISPIDVQWEAMN